MFWGILALGAFIWVGRKFRPAHLGDDILKWEIFRHLRYRNSADAAAHMSYEDLEKRLWLQVTGAYVVFAFTCLLGLMYLASSPIYALTISLTLTTALLLVFVKRSKTYRRITLPLFATLCRIPQSRWDMRARPWNWVRVSPEKGKLWIRLPKDWHAGRAHLRAIQELVNARVSGVWTMTPDTANFLLTFTRESEAETVIVTGNDKETDPLDWVVMEKDIEDGPW